MYKKYFTLYVNIITFFVLINIALFYFSLVLPIKEHFIADNLSLLAIDSSFITRKDWQYSLPFYLLSFPLNAFNEEQVGFLGIPRLFGMSTEPSLYSIVILPTLIMALYFKKYFQSIVLFLALILASSYGAFSIGVIGILFYYFFKYKLLVFYFFILLFLLGYYFGIYDYLSTLSPRLEFYMNLFLNMFKLSSISFFANLSFLNVKELELPSALLSQTLKYGLFLGLSYCFIFYLYIKFSLNTKNKLLFVFTIVSLLIINKSGEILSPLFLFYFTFVYSEYLNFIKRENENINYK